MSTMQSFSRNNFLYFQLLFFFWSLAVTQLGFFSFEKVDAVVAYEIVNYALYHETKKTTELPTIGDNNSDTAATLEQVNNEMSENQNRTGQQDGDQQMDVDQEEGDNNNSQPLSTSQGNKKRKRSEDQGEEESSQIDRFDRFLFFKEEKS